MPYPTLKIAQDSVSEHRRYGWLIVGPLLLVGLNVTSLVSYLLFHSLAEFFSIAISLAIFLFAWNTSRLLDNDYLVFPGIAYRSSGKIAAVLASLVVVRGSSTRN